MAVGVLVRLVEVAGAIVIFIGAVAGFIGFCIVVVVQRDAGSFGTIRLSLGRFLVLGLEFQLAADLLRTAVSPSFDQIAKLAAIVAIRTALNYFLGKELNVESRQLEKKAAP